MVIKADKDFEMFLLYVVTYQNVLQSLTVPSSEILEKLNIFISDSLA